MAANAFADSSNSNNKIMTGFDPKPRRGKPETREGPTREPDPREGKPAQGPRRDPDPEQGKGGPRRQEPR